jgi:pyridoxal phosphate enzyme (YggS family)
MSTLQQRLQAAIRGIHARIEIAAQAAARPASAVTLVAVSKTFDADHVLAAAHAGQVDFGENYVQEAVEKIAAVQAAAPQFRLAWHFIGPIQSNKTRAIAEQFDWVQSVDRLKIAERLSQQRPPARGPLNVLLQVNVSGEATKAGVAPGAVAALADAVAALPGLRLRGLMAIPEPTVDTARQRASFDTMRALFDALRARHPGCDTLSMGMSADLESAVAAGSTMVRIGTAIFGARARPAAVEAA